MEKVIETLCLEPALAWKVAVNIHGHAESSVEARQARLQVAESPLARQLISTCNRRLHPYKKWDGAHWVLASLADLGYPSGDESLRPLMDATLDAYLTPEHVATYTPLREGRFRIHASQEGNAIFSSLRLGFADARTDALVECLLKYRWPDGGWNCDRHPQASISSFHETLIPLRGLALYAQVTGDAAVRRAVEGAAEVFLSRQLFRRIHTGNVIHPSFVTLHYPPYWHYDILFGLKVMAEAGFLSDPRCQPALDLLESKRLPDGGFPAEATYTRPTHPSKTGYSPLSWGGTSIKKMNPFVTADVLYLFRLSGRLSV